MRILIDNCVPRKFARLIVGQEVVLARQEGWHDLKNGQLLAVAEAADFSAIITTDKNLRYQQNIANRKISIIVMSPRLVFFESLAPMIDQLHEALSNLEPGTFEIIVPK